MKKRTQKVRFFRSIASNIRSGSAPIKNNAHKLYIILTEQARKRPLTLYFVLLTLVFVLIVGGNFLRKPKELDEAKHVPIAVKTFQIGSVPKVTMQAQIEKAGVVQIVSQTSGIVHKINVKEGQTIKRGSNLVSLASDYLGGNAAAIQSQLANKQYQNIVDTFDSQKDLITKQKDLAETSDSNSDQLRSIVDKSLDDTRSLVSLNDDILSSINTNLADLEATNVGGVNDDLILQTKQLKSQFTAANNQVRSTLKNAEFSAGDDNDGAKLANLGREITIKQLELQDKSLDLNRETSQLQLRLAQVNASAMYPASPFEATVEKVHVRRGQSVSRNTPLVTIAGNDKTLTATALLDASTAQKVSIIEPSIITIKGETIELIPTHISTEATNGQLYAVTYSIPTEYAQELTDNSFVTVDIPLGYPDSPSSIPFIPIDSVYQSQDSAFVFVADGSSAKSRTISLGVVRGRFVEVTKGLQNQDQVILDRNVISGDIVEVLNI